MNQKQPKYPIYIPSKGRWESRLTSRTLEEMGVDYKIVVEPQEYDNYAAVIDPKKILVLPFSNLGLASIPARNWIWEHAVAAGHERHWVLDCNMRYFYRMYNNSKLKVRSAMPFTVCENYSDRFTNVGVSGLQYAYLTPTYADKPPVYLNSRVYSCILINHELKQRWRVLEWDGKPAPYNEDSDLSINALKDGFCNILFNSFLCGKYNTMLMKGGNTTEVYKHEADGFDNRFAFAASLQKAHPDVVTISRRHGRNHHLIDFSGFQRTNKLILKPGMEYPEIYPEKLKLVRLSDLNNIKSPHYPASIDGMRMEIN